MKIVEIVTDIKETLEKDTPAWISEQQRDLEAAFLAATEISHQMKVSELKAMLEAAERKNDDDLLYDKFCIAALKALIASRSGSDPTMRVSAEPGAKTPGPVSANH
jgi:hypothetical protein